MNLQYVGRHDAVDVLLPSGGIVSAVRDGEPLDVPEDVAASLLAQRTEWKRPAAKAKGEKEA